MGGVLSRHWDAWLSCGAEEWTLSRHWDAWLSCGAEEWTVGVPWDGYRVPIHHLPPVSWVPMELLSAALGTVCALSPQEEVNKMLQQPGPCFYSRRFLLDKVTGGWRHVIDLSSFNNSVAITKFRIETVSSVLGSVRRGDRMISLDLQDAYFQIPLRWESRPYLRFCLEVCDYQFKALWFSLSMAPHLVLMCRLHYHVMLPGVFTLVSEWVYQRGMHLPWLRG